MSYCCEQDDRRHAVRRMKGLNGLDYLEVSDDQRSLQVYFLGYLPWGGAVAQAQVAAAPGWPTIRVIGGLGLDESLVLERHILGFGDDRFVLLELGIGYIDLRIKSHGSSLCLPRMRQSNTY